MTSEITSFWRNGLHSVTLDDDTARRLPAETLHFLLETGLPDSEKLTIEAANFLSASVPLNSMLASVEKKVDERVFKFFYSNLNLVQIDGESFLAIGKKGQDILGLKINTGEVYLLNNQQLPFNHPFPSYPALFANSGIENFLRFLVHLTRSQSSMIPPIRTYNTAVSASGRKTEQKAAETEIQSLILELETALRNIDLRAFEESKSYWKFYMLDLKHSWGMNVSAA